MKQMEPTTKRGLARRRADGDPLFASKGKQPLTPNGVAMVFTRVRVRAEIRDATISPQILRHSFALRYLQAGGNPRGLQELLGYEGMAPVRQYLLWQDQLFHQQAQNKRDKT
jgi:site-specific recombinase XerD